jgi:hypothetical protein
MSDTIGRIAVPTVINSARNFRLRHSGNPLFAFLATALMVDSALEK